MQQKVVFPAILLIATPMTSASLVTINSVTESYSVSLVGPASPEFIPTLRQILTERQIEALKPALPFSVVIKNNSARAIAATGVLFETTQPDGRKYQYYNRVVDLHSPSSAFLSAGQVRFESLARPLKWAVNLRRVDLFLGHPDYQRMLVRVADFSLAKTTTAILDFVVFDDGKFVGPDSCGQFFHIENEGRIRSSFALELAALAENPVGDIRAFLDSKRVPPTGSGPTDIVHHDYGAAEQDRLAGVFLALLQKGGRDAVLQGARTLATQCSKGIKIHR